MLNQFSHDLVLVARWRENFWLVRICKNSDETRQKWIFLTLTSFFQKNLNKNPPPRIFLLFPLLKQKVLFFFVCYLQTTAELPRSLKTNDTMRIFVLFSASSRSVRPSSRVWINIHAGYFFYFYYGETILVISPALLSRRFWGLSPPLL